jgi:hypothetical protein
MYQSFFCPLQVCGVAKEEAEEHEKSKNKEKER